MNKIDIIQRLLDERHITAKEALVLMEKEVVYYPVDHYPPVWPVYPYYYDPGYRTVGDDFSVTSDGKLVHNGQLVIAEN